MFSYIDALPALGLPLAVFMVCAALAGILRRTTRSEDAAHARVLAAAEEKRRGLIGQLERVKSDEARIAEQELSLVSVYEITKKMSASLTFDDIFNVFSACLNEYVGFTTCDLLILRRDDGEPRLDRRYRVIKEPGSEGVSEKAVDYDHILRTFLAKPQEVFITREDGPQAFVSFGLPDEGMESFAGIPLVSDKTVVAALVFQNMPRDDFEKAVILSMQFALEIKKVLLYETVERLSVTDSLTGLYVRRYFFERFQEELERSRSYRFSFAFLMIDIDDFKRCNDTYGHLVGDAVLKDAARIMKEHVREIDLVARYGGEEFALVLPETDRDGAVHAAERIRARIEEHVFKAYDEKLKVTASVGLAFFPADGEKVSELVEKADKALYRAKRSGKNLVCVYGK